MTKVSVIIPTYNRAQYIAATVNSILTQTFTDYEILVVDDGSTDNTRQVLEQFSGRLTYIYQENEERSAARNTGIRAAAGEYIAFIDSDDLWHPKKLERQIALFDQHPEVTLVYCQARYIDHDGRPVRFQGHWVDGTDANGIVIADRLHDLILGNIVSGGSSTPLVRRSQLIEAGMFDVTKNYAEDWDMWLRLAVRGPFAYIPEPLASYRVYGWRRLLKFQSSDVVVQQQLQVIDRAVAHSRGLHNELVNLRQKAVAAVYVLSALGAIQLGQPKIGQMNLRKAIQADPTLAVRERVLWLAVDRATAIEIAAESYEPALTFINLFFDNLPSDVARFQEARREAIGWLYANGAFEKHRSGDSASVRRLLSKAIVYAPVCLTNRGVLSMAVQAWLGKALVRKSGKAN